MKDEEIQNAIELHEKVKLNLSQNITGSHEHLDNLAVELMKWHKLKEIEEELGDLWKMLYDIENTIRNK